MNHTHIEEHGFIERYHRGDLPEDEEILFEEHFLGCAECQEKLMLARGLRKGLRGMAAEDMVAQNLARQAVVGGIFAWLARRGRGAQAGLAMAVLLVLLLPTVWILVGQRQLSSGADGGASPSVLLLAAHRDAPGEPSAVLDLTTTGPTIVLAVDVDDDPRFESFRVTIDDDDGTPVLRREGLRPNALEVLMLSFPSDFFAPGDYRLSVLGVTGDGASVPLGDYSFRVAAAP